MAQPILRDKARILRRRGLSLNEITSRLKVPKSTVRYWCRDVVLSKLQLEQLFNKQKLGGAMSAEKLRKKRLSITSQLYKEGINEIRALSSREQFLIGVSLYWAEGYRKGNSEFGFTNSDPKMIKLIIQWLEKSCKISKGRIRLRICINASHRRRLALIKKFWSKVTRIPLNQFSKPTFIKVRNIKAYINTSEYFGTLRIKVSQGTNLKRKMLGWIEGIARTVK
jgi:hypothetical protein